MAKTLELARAHLQARLMEAGLGRFSDAYVAAARPALILRPAAAACERDVTLLGRDGGASYESDIPVGATKIGGRPDLPRGARWPGGSFVLQIALAEVPEGLIDLPREGLLSLFADPDNPGAATLLWSMPEYGRFGRTVPPDEATLFLPRRVDTEFAYTLDINRPDAPEHEDWDDIAFDALAVPGAKDSIQLGGDPHVLEAMDEALEELSPDSDLPDEARAWKLVLAVGSIEECEMDWGGGLYVFMRGGDLKQRRFENAVALKQMF